MSAAVQAEIGSRHKPVVHTGAMNQPLRRRAFCLTRSDFSGLGPAAASALVASMTWRTHRANEFIYLQDDDAGHLHFVESGHVRLSYIMEDGSSVLHAILPPGESFGELGVFETSRYSDMATAIGTVVTASVSTGRFHALAQEHPELSLALSKAVARRYRTYIALTRDLSLKTLQARLAQALLRLADSLGARGSHGHRSVLLVGAMVTQTDLGLMARGSRGNVNRALKQWERAGWIAMQDRSIAILARSRLEALAINDEL